MNFNEALTEYLASTHGPLPENWSPYCFEAINPQQVVVTGASGRPLKSGPRKGRTTWRDAPPESKRTFVYERDRLHDWIEREKGVCSECLGTGEEWVAWSASDGNKYKPCTRCGATGKPLEDAA